MAKKGLKKNKSSSQKEEETSAMSNACDVETNQEQPNLGSVLRRIVDQIDDAERSNADTLQEMQERLTSLSAQTSEAKHSNSEIDQGALEKIENQIAGLTDRIEIISEGRAINADNLEIRIEALAEQLSSEEAAAEARLQERSKLEKTSSTDNEDELSAEKSGPTLNASTPSAASAPNAEEKIAKKAVEKKKPSPSSLSKTRDEETLDDRADITFAVTDDLDDESSIDPSAVDRLAGEDLQSADETLLAAQVSAGQSKSGKSGSGEHLSHKITATAYDASGPLEPNRLASLAEHFSPVSAPQVGEPESDERDRAEYIPAPAANNSGMVDLEQRFSIIAEKLEVTLANRDKDLQERADISSKFDDLANRFEGWLQANNKSDNFDSIEQKIGALTEHVKNAEDHAEKIGVLEKQLVKLIDIVEKKNAGAEISAELEKNFQEAASRILEEKTAHIADLVASKMEARLDRNATSEKLSELQQSLSTLSSEHRLADTTQSSRLTSVDSTLNAISGRLDLIEEQIQFESMNAPREVKKNLIDREPEKQASDVHVATQDVMPDLPEQQSQVSEPEQAKDEGNSFHTELELSVHQVIDDPTEIEFIPDERGHQHEGTSDSDGPMTLSREPMTLALENEQEGANPPFPPGPQGVNEEYVETARQAAKRAFEKNQLSQTPQDRPGVGENPVEKVRNLISDNKWRATDLGERIKAGIMSLRYFRSTSVLIIGAAGLVLICFGILYKELSGVSKLRRAQLEASRTANWNKLHQIQPGVKNSHRLIEAPEQMGAKHVTTTGKLTENMPVAGKQAAIAQNSGPAENADKNSSRFFDQQREDSQQNGEQPIVSPSEVGDTARGKNAAGGQGAFPERDGTSSGNNGHNGAGISVSFREVDGNRFGQTGRQAFPGAREINLNDLVTSGQKQPKIKGSYVQVGAGAPDKNLKYIRKRAVAGEVDQALLLPEQLGSHSLRTAASSGNYKAQFAVGMRYIEGKRIERNYPAARRWLNRSAAQSFAPAQYHLAVMYEHGQGGARDLGMARTWYKRAARGGNLKAMHNLAVLMTLLSEANPDYAGALHWFKRAANYGYPDSQYNLGILYANGLGVKRDKAEAYKWYSLAAAVGDRQAADKLKRLKFRMSQEDILTAESRLAIWSRKRPSKAANLNAKEVSAFTGRILAPYADIQIYEAQVLLNKLGYNVGQADGQIGPKTRDAVRRFQQKNSLEPSGSITPELIEILRGQVS